MTRLSSVHKNRSYGKKGRTRKRRPTHRKRHPTHRKRRPTHRKRRPTHRKRISSKRKKDVHKKRTRAKRKKHLGGTPPPPEFPYAALIPAGEPMPWLFSDDEFQANSIQDLLLKYTENIALRPKLPIELPKTGNYSARTLSSEEGLGVFSKVRNLEDALYLFDWMIMKSELVPLIFEMAEHEYSWGSKQRMEEWISKQERFVELAEAVIAAVVPRLIPLKPEGDSLQNRMAAEIKVDPTAEKTEGSIQATLRMVHFIVILLGNLLNFQEPPKRGVMPKSFIRRYYLKDYNIQDYPLLYIIMRAANMWRDAAVAYSSWLAELVNTLKDEQVIQRDVVKLYKKRIDEIDVALSNFNMHTSLGPECASFNNALPIVARELAGEIFKMTEEEKYKGVLFEEHHSQEFEADDTVAEYPLWRRQSDPRWRQSNRRRREGESGLAVERKRAWIQLRQGQYASIENAVREWGERGSREESMVAMREWAKLKAQHQVYLCMRVIPNLGECKLGVWRIKDRTSSEWQHGHKSVDGGFEGRRCLTNEHHCRICGATICDDAAIQARLNERSRFVWICRDGGRCGQRFKQYALYMMDTGAEGEESKNWGTSNVLVDKYDWPAWSGVGNEDPKVPTKIEVHELWSTQQPAAPAALPASAAGVAAPSQEQFIPLTIKRAVEALASTNQTENTVRKKNDLTKLGHIIEVTGGQVGVQWDGGWGAAEAVDPDELEIVNPAPAAPEPSPSPALPPPAPAAEEEVLARQGSGAAGIVDNPLLPQAPAPATEPEGALRRLGQAARDFLQQFSAQPEPQPQAVMSPEALAQYRAELGQQEADLVGDFGALGREMGVAAAPPAPNEG